MTTPQLLRVIVEFPDEVFEILNSNIVRRRVWTEAYIEAITNIKRKHLGFPRESPITELELDLLAWTLSDVEWLKATSEQDSA